MRPFIPQTSAAAAEILAQELRHPYELFGGEGGLHLTVAIDNVDDLAIVQQARRFQLAPGALSRFYLDVKTARSGFVLGYGNTSASHFRAAVRTLSRLIALDRRG